MYSNNILNYQESTTILNAHTKKVWKLIVCTLYLQVIILDKNNLQLNDIRYLLVYPHGVMVKAKDNGILVSESKLQSRYYVHFRTNTLGKGMTSFILAAVG